MCGRIDLRRPEGPDHGRKPQGPQGPQEPQHGRKPQGPQGPRGPQRQIGAQLAHWRH